MTMMWWPECLGVCPQDRLGRFKSYPHLQYMTAQDYILQRLEDIQGTKIEPAKELIDFIYATIMSKKFRKYSVPPHTQDMFRTAIKLNIEKSEPIKIAIPFGAYKLW